VLVRVFKKVLTLQLRQLFESGPLHEKQVISHGKQLEPDVSFLNLNLFQIFFIKNIKI